MFKIFIFFMGFGLTVIGLVYIISYLNLLAFGYKFIEYVNFISRRIECIVAFIGIVLMTISFVIVRGEKYELHI